MPLVDEVDRAIHGRRGLRCYVMVDEVDNAMPMVDEVYSAPHSRRGLVAMVDEADRAIPMVDEVDGDMPIVTGRQCYPQRTAEPQIRVVNLELVRGPACTISVASRKRVNSTLFDRRYCLYVRPVATPCWLVCGTV